MIEGALEAEAGVLAGYVAAQLRVHGATRGRYVLPSTLRAALPPPPTLQIPVSTRATSPLRGAAMPPEAPSRQLAVPTGGGAGTATAAAQPLLLTVPAVATAPVGRRHVAASAVAAAAGGQQGDEKKAEEEGEFLKPQPPQPLPPQPTRAELRALAAAAEADRQAALVAIRSAAGEAPPAASAKQAKASRGGGKRGGGVSLHLPPQLCPPFPSPPCRRGCHCHPLPRRATHWRPPSPRNRQGRCLRAMLPLPPRPLPLQTRNLPRPPPLRFSPQPQRGLARTPRTLVSAGVVRWARGEGLHQCRHLMRCV